MQIAIHSGLLPRVWLLSGRRKLRLHHDHAGASVKDGGRRAGSGAVNSSDDSRHSNTVDVLNEAASSNYVEEWWGTVVLTRK
jgi:hypothetical protein